MIDITPQKIFDLIPTGENVSIYSYDRKAEHLNEMENHPCAFEKETVKDGIAPDHSR